MSGLHSDEDMASGTTCERGKESFENIGLSSVPSSECVVPSSQDSQTTAFELNLESLQSGELSQCSNTAVASGSEYDKSVLEKSSQSKKKAKNNQWSQLSLRSFFKKSPNIDNVVIDSRADNSNSQAESSHPSCHLQETLAVVDHSAISKQPELDKDACDQDPSELNDDSTRKERSSVALQEWQRIQQLMQNSIPLCKGHKEPCIARVVKKQGPNFGHRFYVCARAEVVFFFCDLEHRVSNSLR